LIVGSLGKDLTSLQSEILDAPRAKSYDSNISCHGGNIAVEHEHVKFECYGAGPKLEMRVSCKLEPLLDKFVSKT
jgi:hypothetical protein